MSVLKCSEYKRATVFVGLMGFEQPESSGSLATPVHLRRSGSLSLDPGSFKATQCPDTESGNHYLQMICLSKEHLKCAFGTFRRMAKTISKIYCVCACFSYAPNIVCLLSSGIQGTHAHKEPHCYSPHLPLALLPTIHISRKKSDPHIAPSSGGLGPLYVQHLAKSKRDQPPPAGQPACERHSRARSRYSWSSTRVWLAALTPAVFNTFFNTTFPRGPPVQQMLSPASSCLPNESVHVLFPPGSEQ